MKKLLQLTLMALCFCAFTNKATAQPQWEGTGSSTDPYLIKTVADIKDLSYCVNSGSPYCDGDYKGKFFRLVSDIDCAGESLTPIGFIDEMDGVEIPHPFSGIFNGNGKKITNLSINVATYDNIGFFGYIDGATIENLGLVNIDLKGRDHVGAVVGYADNKSNISNCYSTGSITGNNRVGGVVGHAHGGSTTKTNISNCYSTSNVKGNEKVGGVAGYLYCSTVSNCYSTGKIEGTKEVGGIAGTIFFWSSALHCYAIGEISGENYVGGVVGWDYNESTVSDCAALNPAVKGTTNVGRVTGYKDANSTLSNNIAFGDMLNKAGNSNWTNTGEDKLDGNSRNKEEINSDGTLGGRFTTGWKTSAKRLPGLFGIQVLMPTHLRLSLTPYIQTLECETGKVGVSYTTLISAIPTTISDEEIVWSLTSGTLPPGLTLEDESGMHIVGTTYIYGTPTTKGTYTFKLTARPNQVFLLGYDEQSFTIVITDGVGIDELTMDNGQLTIYPNPTTGELTIDNGELTINNVEVYDIMGKTLNNCQLSIINYQLKIDVSHLPAGVYFLKANNKTAKFIKQ